MLKLLKRQCYTLSKQMRMKTRNSSVFSCLLLILANILWACSYVAAKYALRDISVFMMNALIMMLAAIVLLSSLIVVRKHVTLTRGDLPQLALLAFIGLV